MTVAAERGMRRHAAVSLLVTAFVLFIMLRSGTAQSFATLLPMYFQSLGYAPAQFGFMLSIFSFAGALGTLAGGYLGDRYNRRLIMAFSSMLAAPFAFLMLHTHGAAYIAVAIGAGIFLSMPHSLIMVLSQELAPARRGLVGGLTLGFIFASGSGMAWLASIAAEQVGLPLVLNAVAFFPLVAGFIAFLLPASKREQPRPAPVPAAPSAAAD
jgi:FSR family fosmidomycin resistance protein-like MFS transporter